MSEDSSKPVKKGAYGAGFAILVTILAFVGSAVLATIIVPSLPYLWGWNEVRIDDWLQHSVAAQFLYVLCVEAFTVGILWWFLRTRRGQGIKEQLGVARRPEPADAKWAFLGALGYFVSYILIATIVGMFVYFNPDQKQEIGFTANNTVGVIPLIMAFVSLVILPPLVEELAFRGFLFGGLRRSLPLWPAAILTSLIFALPHTLQSSQGVFLLIGIDTFVLSLVLCWLRVRTGSIWAGVGVHAIKNGIAFLSLFIFASH